MPRQGGTERIQTVDLTGQEGVVTEWVASARVTLPAQYAPCCGGAVCLSSVTVVQMAACFLKEHVVSTLPSRVFPSPTTSSMLRSHPSTTEHHRAGSVTEGPLAFLSPSLI